MIDNDTKGFDEFNLYSYIYFLLDIYLQIVNFSLLNVKINTEEEKAIKKGIKIIYYHLNPLLIYSIPFIFEDIRCEC